jgi:hypothetical protein
LSASGDSAIIEVQQWMNRVSLDSIGEGGFSHSFEATSNPSVESPIQIAFNTFATTRPTVSSVVVFLLQPIFPFLFRLPTGWNKVWRALKETMKSIGEELLERNRTVEGAAKEKSIMGLLSTCPTLFFWMKISDCTNFCSQGRGFRISSPNDRKGNPGAGR